MRPTYKHINWNAAPSSEVTTHPLWGFHEAILARAHQLSKANTPQTLWALASIKSLIEIDINREFVLEAGLAYEADVDNGVYVQRLDNPLFFDKRHGVTSQFDAFRTATAPNAQSSDLGKGDVLRTSRVKVSSSGAVEHVSFHPSVSYPTQHLPVSERKANKSQQMNFFYDGFAQMCQRALQLPREDQRHACLDAFVQNIKVHGIGCANERLGTALDVLGKQVNQFEDKTITQDNFLTLIQGIVMALSAGEFGNATGLFSAFLTQHDGYKVQGEAWSISESSKDQLAAKIIADGIDKLYILDEASREAYQTALIPKFASKKPDLVIQLAPDHMLRQPASAFFQAVNSIFDRDASYAREVTMAQGVSIMFGKSSHGEVYVFVEESIQGAAEPKVYSIYVSGDYQVSSHSIIGCELPGMHLQWMIDNGIFDVLLVAERDELQPASLPSANGGGAVHSHAAAAAASQPYAVGPVLAIQLAYNEPLYQMAQVALEVMQRGESRSVVIQGTQEIICGVSQQTGCFYIQTLDNSASVFDAALAGYHQVYISRSGEAKSYNMLIRADQDVVSEIHWASGLVADLKEALSTRACQTVNRDYIASRKSKRGSYWSQADNASSLSDIVQHAWNGHSKSGTFFGTSRFDGAATKAYLQLGLKKPAESAEQLEMMACFKFSKP